jgi:hypothetical protein
MNWMPQSVDHDPELWRVRSSRVEALLDGRLAETKDRVLATLIAAAVVTMLGLAPGCAASLAFTMEVPMKHIRDVVDPPRTLRRHESGGKRQRLKAWTPWHARDLHERAQRAAGYGYRCPKCNSAMGNQQRNCSNGKCGHVDRTPRDPAKKLLGFHAHRRKWATERKHLPLKDVAEAGGWMDTRSLEQCYQQAGEATLWQVITEPRKLRETIPQTIPAGAGK